MSLIEGSVAHHEKVQAFDKANNRGHQRPAEQYVNDSPNRFAHVELVNAETAEKQPKKPRDGLGAGLPLCDAADVPVLGRHRRLAYPAFRADFSFGADYFSTFLAELFIHSLCSCVHLCSPSVAPLLTCSELPKSRLIRHYLLCHCHPLRENQTFTEAKRHRHPEIGCEARGNILSGCGCTWMSDEPTTSSSIAATLITRSAAPISPAAQPRHHLIRVRLSPASPSRRTA